MDAFLVTELVDLAFANPTAPEARVEKMFDWYFAREIETIKWSPGAASGMLVALLPGMLDPNKYNIAIRLDDGGCRTYLLAQRRWA